MSLRSILTSALVVGLFYSTSALAGYKIIGKIPNDYLFLNQLSTLSLLNEHEEQDINKFAEIHLVWIGKIYELVQLAQTDLDVKIPAHHPVRYFNQQDARIILQPILKNTYNLDLSQDLIERLFSVEAQHFINHHKPTDSVFFRQRKTKEYTYQAALKVVELAKGSTLLVIGQSPVYIAAMVKTINQYLKDKEKIDIVEIPISGRPDLVTLERHPKTWEIAYKNILTRDREMFFRRLLSDKGFQPKDYEHSRKPVFILDYSSGPSVAAFLLLMTKWFNEEGIKPANFFFLNMAARKDVLVTRDGKWYTPPKHEPLNLKINDSLKFEIETIYLDMEKETLFAFADIKDNLRVVPAFNALFWRFETHSLFEQYPRKDAKKLLLKYQNYAIGRYRYNAYQPK